MTEFLDLKLADSTLLKLALTHSSYTKDHPDEDNNERLEFYGDSVLKLIFSEYLYYRYPDANEGELTKYRARLISDDLLATIGEELGISNKIIVGSSLSGKTKLPRSIIGDVLEAVIGAIYIDQGYDRAESFVMQYWAKYIDDAIRDAMEKDYKSMLQERIQKEYKEAPQYQTLSSSGPDHDKEFEIGVFVGDRLLGKASGNSKKEAGQNAAKAALEAL